jgi:AraC-like DNA-binding protein
VLHPDVSLALVSVLFNLHRADEGQIRTQLAWAIADEGLSFPERVATVEALGQVFAPASDAERRRQVAAWLRRGLGRRFADLSPVVRTFVTLITVDASRTWQSKTEALAAEAGTSMAELSRLVHQELSVSPNRCRLIGHLTPALKALAHTSEQVAQIAYQLGYNLPTTFDNRFKELWGLTPTGYREVLTGLVEGA